MSGRSEMPLGRRADHVTPPPSARRPHRAAARRHSAGEAALQDEAVDGAACGTVPSAERDASPAAGRRSLAGSACTAVFQPGDLGVRIRGCVPTRRASQPRCPVRGRARRRRPRRSRRAERRPPTRGRPAASVDGDADPAFCGARRHVERRGEPVATVARRPRSLTRLDADRVLPALPGHSLSMAWATTSGCGVWRARVQEPARAVASLNRVRSGM